MRSQHPEIMKKVELENPQLVHKSKSSQIDDDVIDSIAALTNLSFGDVRSQISENGFETIAVQALKSFKKSYYQQWLGQLSDEEELDELKILTDCLISIDEELENCKDENRKIILSKEAQDIKDMIDRVRDETNSEIY